MPKPGQSVEYVAATSTAAAKTGSLGDRWRHYTLKDRVSITADSAYATVGFQLPENCRVAWAMLHNADALDIKAANTTGATTLKLSYCLSNVAPTSLTTNATTDLVQISAAGTMATSTLIETVAANAKSRGVPVNTAKQQNTSTSKQTLYLFPYAATTATSNAQVFNCNTSAATSGYHFDTAAEVLVTVCVEEFIDTADE